MHFENIYKKSGERIKFLRKQKHLIRERLAETAEISLDYLGKIEVNINYP